MIPSGCFLCSAIRLFALWFNTELVRYYPALYSIYPFSPGAALGWSPVIKIPFNMSGHYAFYLLAEALIQTKHATWSHTWKITLSPMAIKSQLRLSTSLFIGPQGIEKWTTMHVYDEHSVSKGHILKIIAFPNDLIPPFMHQEDIEISNA